MITFLQSIGDRWQANEALCSLMPYARVFTGRIPSTEEYRMPYVSIVQGPAKPVYRSDKTQTYNVAMAFHIWVDDSDLATAERIEAAIVAAFADSTWSFDSGFGQGRVLDVLDEGPAAKQQVHQPTFKAWQAVKAMSLLVERDRVDTSLDASSYGEESSS